MGCRGIEIWVAETTEHTKGGVIRELLMKELVGDDMLYRSRWARLSRYVAAAKASAQYGGGMEAWSSKVRMVLLMVRSMRSALPFCWEV